MGILLFILFGLIVGIIAKWLVPGEGPGGILGDIIVGIIGAFIGGWLFSVLGHAEFTTGGIGSWISAIIGAVILLLILRAIAGRRTTVP